MVEAVQEQGQDDAGDEDYRRDVEQTALDFVLAEGCFGLIPLPSQGQGRRLDRILELCRGPNGRYENLIDIVSDKNTLLAAYQRLKVRPGLKIPQLGSGELPLNWLRLTRESLLAGAYEFQHYHARNVFRKFGARATQHTLADRYTFLLVNLWAMRTKRAEIFSGNCEFYWKKGRRDPLRSFNLDFFLDYGLHSKYKHPLSSPFPPVGDLIVQEAMQMALEKIYEPLLSPKAHGYRPNRGCHTLLEDVRSNRWLGVCWLLEFNFDNIYAKIDTDLLASMLEQEIEDKGFVELILKLFDVKATVAEDVKYSPKTLAKNPQLAKNKYEHEELGVRRSVLAPLLCHVYLRSLDDEISRMILEQERVPTDRGRRTIFNVRSNPVPASKELPINLQYVRYLDEFVVGVGASRAIAERIQALILKFMKTELHLEPDYASYVDISFGSTLFLGMRITAAESTYDPRTEAKRLEKRRRSKFRNVKLRELRERVWSDRMKRLTLHAWMLGLRKVSRELPDLEQCKSMVRLKSENMVRDFTIAKLRSGMTRLAVEELLNTENAVFYNMSALGIPEEITKAHQHLTDLLEKHYRSILKENRDPKPVLPKNKSKRLEMVQTYGALPIRLIAPLDTIMAELRYIGMIKPDSIRPDAVCSFLNAPDESIVSYFAAIAYALLVYYRCSDNYIKVKRIVDYQVRWSALITLAAKHDFTTRKSILEFKRGPQMVKGQDVVASLPSTPAISRFGTMFYDNIQETMLQHIMSGSRRPRSQ
ncbi:uncharacterized protein LOC112344431 [Selaginella moellendorffii]|uniref:uncharacterized protein LOC112344431 n=1 Tax=Selaginella moellendorffii TaxID=88036 RepID=UPI000D1C9565|nr:uncharacterized protein LOC112344431 [Selaginella moellendorffii]|eukprot:XP_024524942.1 uncharacterized protein LOC112344431 [Selaginella moellendorffii]